MSDAATAHKPMPMLPQSAPGDEPRELGDRTGSSASSALRRARAHALVPQGRRQMKVDHGHGSRWEVVPPITKAAGVPRRPMS